MSAEMLADRLRLRRWIVDLDTYRRERGGLAGQAFTGYVCALCSQERMHHNTGCPLVCDECRAEVKAEGGAMSANVSCCEVCDRYDECPCHVCDVEPPWLELAAGCWFAWLAGRLEDKDHVIKHLRDRVSDLEALRVKLELACEDE